MPRPSIFSTQSKGAPVVDSVLLPAEARTPGELFSPWAERRRAAAENVSTWKLMSSDKRAALRKKLGVSGVACLKPKFLKGIGPVRCEKCLVCINDRANRLATEAQFEVEAARGGLFVTLTYAQEHLPQSLDEWKLHRRQWSTRFNARWRHQYLHLGLPPRMLGVAHLGREGGRPHFHFCIFTPHFSEAWHCAFESWRNLDAPGHPQRGYVHRTGELHPGRSTCGAYVARYMVKEPELTPGRQASLLKYGDVPGPIFPRNPSLGSAIANRLIEDLRSNPQALAVFRSAPKVAIRLPGTEGHSSAIVPVRRQTVKKVQEALLRVEDWCELGARRRRAQEQAVYLAGPAWRAGVVSSAPERALLALRKRRIGSEGHVDVE